jgi:protein-S-isoprenylcysteine O-methyltransferase Ste14
MRLREALKRQGSWLFKWRSYLPLLVLFIAVPAFWDTVAASTDSFFDFEDVWELICLGVALFGLAIRVYTVGHAPAGTSGRNREGQRADVLNTTGSYSLVRHPLYVGNFFMWLGISMFVRCWWLSLVFVLLFILFYERIIYTEEEYLSAKFGAEWREWAARTPLFFPRFKNFKRPALPFSIRNVMSKEHHVFLLIILAFAFLEIVEELLMERRFEVDAGWVIAVACAAALWTTLRILKKMTTVLNVEGR